MKRCLMIVSATSLIVAVALFGIIPSVDAQEKVPIEGSDRHYIRYADGTVSINDICPIAKKNLGASKIPIYVNGRPVGFC